jgi:hypothetical protein
MRRPSRIACIRCVRTTPPPSRETNRLWRPSGTCDVSTMTGVKLHLQRVLLCPALTYVRPWGGASSLLCDDDDKESSRRRTVTVHSSLVLAYVVRGVRYPTLRAFLDSCELAQQVTTHAPLPQAAVLSPLQLRSAAAWCLAGGVFGEEPARTRWCGAGEPALHHRAGLDHSSQWRGA